MENFEIILEGFKKDQLDEFIFKELKLSELSVKSSHFFDQKKGQDIEFHQVSSFQNILSPHGTGNILLHKIYMGYLINDVILILSFSENFGEITLNFKENELFKGEDLEVSTKVKKMLNFIINIKKRFNIPKVKIGFEPAYDKDTCLVEIIEDEIDFERVTTTILS